MTDTNTDQQYGKDLASDLALSIQEGFKEHGAPTNQDAFKAALIESFADHVNAEGFCGKQ